MDKKDLLSKQRKDEIIKQTSYLLKGIPNLGRVDIVRLASDLKFKVLRLVESATISGLIIVNTEGKPISKYIPFSRIIAFKSSLDENSNRFIIAHELGHYFLHCKDYSLGTNIFKYEYHNEGSKDEVKEAEADFFAANLLVPNESFIKEYNALGEIKDTQLGKDELARHFGVTVSCIELRIGEVFDEQ